ncbi:MAG: cation:proton antiporter [Actinomycetota bacterium]
MTTAEINVRVLLALAVVIAGSRLAGWAISKIGQPRVHGEILAGILLGPSLLGVVWPETLAYLFPTEVIGALRVLAQIGLVLFMFLIGLELDLDKLRGQGHKAVVISHASIIAPMLLGAALALWLYPRLGGDADRLGFTLFIGAAMAITAFPVLARDLQETGLYHTRIGVLTITCAAVDDVTAWCVLAIVVAVVESAGFGEAAVTIALSVAFLIAMLKLVKPALQRMPSVPMWMTICLALSAAWVTELIGIHAIFGAFMAGTSMPRDAEVRREVHERLEASVVTFLLPVFFVVVGLATRVDLLDSFFLWGVTLLVIATAIAGKWGGSMFAGRAMGETWQDAAAIGILMNTRGLTELVILTVGLELGVIGTTLFTMGVLMALVTTLMATPMLALLSPLHHRGMTAAMQPIGPDGILAERSGPATGR